MPQSLSVRNRCGRNTGFGTGRVTSEMVTATVAGRRSRRRSASGFVPIGAVRAARIASYLALDGQRVEAPKGAGFVQTAVAKDVHTVCQYSHVNRDIGLVYGEAGMGKTYALREYQRAHPDTILLRCNPSWKTPQAMLEAVLLEVGRKVRGMNALHRHIRELVGALEETGRLVILDEAQFLGTRSLEVVRTLHDEAEVGIVLSGNLDVYSQMHGEGMASFAQLFSRVGIRRQILLGAPRSYELALRWTL